MHNTSTTKTAAFHSNHMKTIKGNWNITKRELFIPNSNAWKVIIKNNTDETVWLNWKQAGFIVNGRASGISLYPFTTDEAPLETIKHNQEINRTITATNLITEKGISKIYHKKKFRKNGRTSVTIVFPMTVGNKPQFFHTFNFTVTKDN